MIKIAICIRQLEKSEQLLKQITKSFMEQGLPLCTVICANSRELLSKSKGCLCPDILLFDINAEDGRLRKAALTLKQRNRKMICVISEKSDYIDFKDNLMLQPLYSLQSRTSQLWAYICKTYPLLVSDNNSFTYYHRPEYNTVLLDTVLYFYSEGRKTHVVTNTGSDVFYYKLDEVEQLLQDKEHHFTRVHKSYLVNTDFITKYSRRSLTLETGQTLTISRYEYYKAINQLKPEAAQ